MLAKEIVMDIRRVKKADACASLGSFGSSHSVGISLNLQQDSQVCTTHIRPDTNLFIPLYQVMGLPPTSASKIYIKLWLGNFLSIDGMQLRELIPIYTEEHVWANDMQHIFILNFLKARKDLPLSNRKCT